MIWTGKRSQGKSGCLLSGFRLAWFLGILSLLIAVGGWAAGQQAHASIQKDCGPGTFGIEFGGTEIQRISVITPEGGTIHEVHGHTHVVVGTCPPISGELTYRLQIKVRRGLVFKWISTGTKDVKDVSNLPEGTEFTLHSYRHCNPHGSASYRVRLFAAPGTNGDGTPSPPAVRYLPRNRGVKVHCR